ncbi:GNAT family N-acetyltransferase [bacterium]|nr:GNAT family N-acetyltransferase [bacterium]
MSVITCSICDCDELTYVIELGNRNSKTLGFLPAGAYNTYCEQEKIIVAKHDEVIVGYLLYSEVRRRRQAYIVHLCVEQGHRRKGVSRSLFEHFESKTKELYTGVRVRCRRDYAANKLWPRLGFKPVAEMDGRSKWGSRLTVWWYDYGHPDLFTDTEEVDSATKVCVTLDANIFFQIERLCEHVSKDVDYLKADWIDSRVQLSLTNEIYNEINRNPDESARYKNRKAARKYKILSQDGLNVERLAHDIALIVGDKDTESARSDSRHLAIAALSRAEVFVTQDRLLLRSSVELSSQLSVDVMTPTELVLRIDELISKADYQPVRFAGSTYSVGNVRATEYNRILDVFHRTEGVKRRRFEAELKEALMDGGGQHVEIVWSERREPLFIYYVKTLRAGWHEVSLFKTAGADYEDTMARFVISGLVERLVDSGTAIVMAREKVLATVMKRAFEENGFVYTNGIFIKIALRHYGDSRSAANELEALSERYRAHSDVMFVIGRMVRGLLHNQARQLLYYERKLWPCKLSDVGLQLYIIPIKPIWAMKMFESRIASGDLFGSDPRLMFNYENVYYRSAIGVEIQAPARILWYVSQDPKRGVLEGAIRAVSYLDEVSVGKPKELYSKYRTLGVYRWNELVETAKGDYDNNIMALRFSNTEICKKPLGISKMRDIWKHNFKHGLCVQGPMRITEKMYEIINQEIM